MRRHAIDPFHSLFFFFNDTATTEIYTLSLHDALPISAERAQRLGGDGHRPLGQPGGDRKSTRLNSSHVEISYAVFCLKKKKKTLHALWSNKRKIYPEPKPKSAINS